RWFQSSFAMQNPSGNSSHMPINHHTVTCTSRVDALSAISSMKLRRGQGALVGKPPACQAPSDPGRKPGAGLRDEAWKAESATTRTANRVAGSHVEIGHLQRVFLDEVASRFDHITHQRRED